MNYLSKRWTAAEYIDEVCAVERDAVRYLQEVLSSVMRTVSKLLSHSWFKQASWKELVAKRNLK